MLQAARFGSADAAKLLVTRLSSSSEGDGGANGVGRDSIANVVDDSGRTPLHCAAQSGHRAVVEVLTTVSSVDVNAADRSGRTSLHLAAGNGHSDVVRVLIAMPQIDIGVVDSSGETAVHYASWRGYKGVVQLLSDAANVDMDAENSSGWTPNSIEKLGDDLLSWMLRAKA